MALNFNSSTDFLSRDIDILNYNAVYTWQSWFRFTTLSTFDTLMVISKDTTTSDRDILMLGTSDATKLTLRVMDAGLSTTVAGTTTLSTGVWYHIALVRESTTSCKVYLDGALEITNTRNIGTRAAAGMMRMALDQSGSNALACDIAAGKAWASALSTTQLATERRFIRPMDITNLYASWPMLASQRNADWAGRGRAWTENGTISDTEGPPLSWGDSPILILYQAGTSVNLAGSTALTFDGTAALAVGKPLAGSAALMFDGTAALAVAKPLAGSTALTFDGVAGLAVGKPLAGSAALMFDGAAGLAVGKPLAGSAALMFDGTAALAVAKPLAGSTALVFGGVASLSLGNTIPPDGRVYAPVAEDRFYAPAAEDRFYAAEET